MITLLLLTMLRLLSFGLPVPPLSVAESSYFINRAKFSVDNTTVSPSSPVATLEPRLGAPGYSWLRIRCYPSPLKPADIAKLTNGGASAINQMPLNQWQAALQLEIDKDFKIWQVDMAIPGHTCTVVDSEQDVQRSVQAYHFDGKHLTLKSKGTHVCDFSLLKLPSQTFSWDVNLSMPVFSKNAAKSN